MFLDVFYKNISDITNGDADMRISRNDSAGAAANLPSSASKPCIQTYTHHAEAAAKTPELFFRKD